MTYTRFAIYYLPPLGPLADFGASWLGWDVNAGCAVRQPDIKGLCEATAAPRKYGFHGTLKPPFCLASGETLGGLITALADLARQTKAAQIDGLDVTALGRFLALTPRGDTLGLNRIAAECVTKLDRFRAPATEQKLARRRKTGQSVRQEALLLQWGYPYVLDEFRFHMTLTGRLAKHEVTKWKDTAEAMLPPLPCPFDINEIALCGEREDGRFEVIQRLPLIG